MTTVRVLTWNVNSLRAAGRHLEDVEIGVIENMDVLFLQETRMGHDNIEMVRTDVFHPFEIFNVEFPSHLYGGTGLGRNGVAIFVRGGSCLGSVRTVKRWLPGWSEKNCEGRYLEVQFSNGGSDANINLFPNSQSGKR